MITDRMRALGYGVTPKVWAAVVNANRCSARPDLALKHLAPLKIAVETARASPTGLQPWEPDYVREGYVAILDAAKRAGRNAGGGNNARKDSLAALAVAVRGGNSTSCLCAERGGPEITTVRPTEPSLPADRGLRARGRRGRGRRRGRAVPHFKIPRSPLRDGRRRLRARAAARRRQQGPRGREEARGARRGALAQHGRLQRGVGRVRRRGPLERRAPDVRRVRGGRRRARAVASRLRPTPSLVPSPDPSLVPSRPVRPSSLRETWGAAGPERFWRCSRPDVGVPVDEVTYNICLRVLAKDGACGCRAVTL